MARRLGGVGSVGPERRERPRVQPAPTKRMCWRGALCSTSRKLAQLTLLAVLNCSLCEISFGGDLTVRTTNPPRTIVEIPFKAYQGYLIVVDGRIGNLEHQNLLLDTGSNPSMIDRSVSAKLGLQGSSRNLSLFNKSVSSESVTLPDVQCGPLQRQNLAVMVADFSAIGHGLGVRIDAVIGLDVLGATNFTVDYAKRRILFGTASVEHHTVPFSSGEQFITVNVKSGGRQLHLLVDTGTPQLVLFESRLRGVDYVQTSVVGNGHNASGNVRFGAIVLPQAKIGTLEVGPQAASVVKSQQDFANDLDGLMGLSCLRPKRISFDFDRQLLGWSD
jgi:predicted aspartyl protease